MEEEINPSCHQYDRVYQKEPVGILPSLTNIDLDEFAFKYRQILGHTELPGQLQCHLMITGWQFKATTRYFDFPLLIGFALCQLLFELLWVGVVHFKEKFIGGCIGIKFLNFLKCSFIKRAQRYSRLLSVIVNKVNLAGENIQDSFIFHRSQTLCK